MAMQHLPAIRAEPQAQGRRIQSAQGQRPVTANQSMPQDLILGSLGLTQMLDELGAQLTALLERHAKSLLRFHLAPVLEIEPEDKYDGHRDEHHDWNHFIIHYLLQLNHVGHSPRFI